MAGPPEIKNIKIHFEVCPSQLSQFRARVSEMEHCGHLTRHSNFLTLSKNSSEYTKQFTFIVFPSRGYANATGLRDYTQLSACVDDFCAAFHLSRRHLKPGIAIDNITASGCLSHELDLRKLMRELANSPHSVFYNINHYPGLKFKVKNLGTAILFSSGKYTIVGLKCSTNAGAILELLAAAITQASITEKDMKSVKPAVL